MLGPNYNATMDTTALPQALDAVQEARLRAHTATPKERALKGLQISLLKQGKTTEACEAERQYRAAWKYAERELEGSVL